MFQRHGAAMPATQAAGLLLHTWVTDITAHNIPAWGTFHHGSCLLHCTALHHVPHHAMLRYTTAHYTMPHYSTLGYTHYMPHFATHYTTLHYNTPHQAAAPCLSHASHPCMLPFAASKHNTHRSRGGHSSKVFLPPQSFVSFFPHSSRNGG